MRGVDQVRLELFHGPAYRGTLEDFSFPLGLLDEIGEPEARGGPDVGVETATNGLARDFHSGIVGAGVDVLE